MLQINSLRSARPFTRCPHPPYLPARPCRPVRAVNTPDAPPAGGPAADKPEGIQPQVPIDAQQGKVEAPAPVNDSIQAKAAAFLQAIGKYRRVIAVVVAVLDVAFIWVAIKGAKYFFFDGN